MILTLFARLPALNTQARRTVVKFFGVAAFIVSWHAIMLLCAQLLSLPLLLDMTPLRTFATLYDLLLGVYLWQQIVASVERVIFAMIGAVMLGVPLGIAYGRSKLFADICHIPFQFLRMVSPLSWMPFAVLVFATWQDAIIFLLLFAALWPVLFATAAGIGKIAPQWLLLMKSFRASRLRTLRYVIVPAIAQDIVTGIRLALGICWVVLVPAEYLGVTSGLGYAINDARDTLSYDSLFALMLVIGALGYSMDSMLGFVHRKMRWYE